MWHLTTLLLTAAPLSFDAAISLVDQTPALVASDAATRERRAALTTLSPLSANPQLTLQPGFRTLPSQPTGPEGFVVLSQIVNLGGLSTARLAVATSESEASATLHQKQRRALRTDVARAWFDAWVAHAAIEAMREERLLAKELVTRVQRAMPSGAVTRVELATARTFEAEVHAQLLDWEDRAVEAAARLGTLLSLEALPEVADELPALAPVELATPQLAQLPQVRLLNLEADLEARRGDEVAAQWASQFQLSLQFGHEWQGQWVGSAGVGFTLPVFERGQRERAGHRATRLRLLGEVDQALRAAGIEWQRLQHELEHTEHALEVIKGEQWPAAQEAAELEQRRYAQGEATLLELTLLRRQAIAARVATLAAQANLLDARYRAAALRHTIGETP